jgi:putative multiple sugar transport system permease protein
MSFINVVQKMFKENIREYGMYIAFLVIIVYFTITTNGLFISSRNINNLLNATSYIAVLAVGMTLVIVIRHIDLSVGFLAGFLGAVAATAMKFWGWSSISTILFVLALGTLAGMLTAFLVARMQIPAFVATLAGALAYRGALQMITAGTGTIIISDDGFNAIGNGFIPDFTNFEIFPEVHTLTLLLGLLAIILFIRGEIISRRKTQSYQFEVLPRNIFIIKLVFVSALIAAITWVLAGYQGPTWPKSSY